MTCRLTGFDQSKPLTANFEQVSKKSPIMLQVEVAPEFSWAIDALKDEQIRITAFAYPLDKENVDINHGHATMTLSAGDLKIEVPCKYVGSSRIYQSDK